jgi:hypothetical protein
VFRAVHVLQVNAEQRIRQPSRLCWQGKVDVYDEGGDEREDDAEAETVEPGVRVRRPDCAVVVRVEEVDVLLQDGLVRVFGGPGVCKGAGGVGVCGGNVDACGSFKSRY